MKKFFPSINSASRELEIDKRSIQRAVNGERNGAGNYHFVKSNELEKIIEVVKKDIGKNTRVYCYENNQIFSSI